MSLRARRVGPGFRDSSYRSMVRRCGRRTLLRARGAGVEIKARGGTTWSGSAGAAPPAVVRGGVAGDDGRKEAADVVAGGPEAPEGAALAVRVPGRQDARARRRAQALQAQAAALPACQGLCSRQRPGHQDARTRRRACAPCARGPACASRPGHTLTGKYPESHAVGATAPAMVATEDTRSGHTAQASTSNATPPGHAHLQQAVERPEGEQHRVGSGRAKEDVDRRRGYQAACPPAQTCTDQHTCSGLLRGCWCTSQQCIRN